MPSRRPRCTANFGTSTDRGPERCGTSPRPATERSSSRPRRRHRSLGLRRRTNGGGSSSEIERLEPRVVVSTTRSSSTRSASTRTLKEATLPPVPDRDRAHRRARRRERGDDHRASERPLIPMPEEQARDLLRAQLERLLPVAESLGVTIALEPVPFGFLQTAAEVARVRPRDRGSSDSGITLDCANSFFAGADPGRGGARAGEARRARRTSATRGEAVRTHAVGRAEIDFAGFAPALGRVGIHGHDRLRAGRRGGPGAAAARGSRPVSPSGGGVDRSP